MNRVFFPGIFLDEVNALLLPGRGSPRYIADSPSREEQPAQGLHWPQTRYNADHMPIGPIKLVLGALQTVSHLIGSLRHTRIRHFARDRADGVLTKTKTGNYCRILDVSGKTGER